jgi:hypothetical protein
MIIFLQNVYLYDFIDLHNRSVVHEWADGLPMQKRERGKLDSKIDMLEKEGDNLPPGLLQPTRCRHIKEIAVKGGVAIRIMLCRGPFDMKREFTFLYGCTEKNRKYVPKDSPERAEGNRIELEANEKRRCIHEDFNKQTSGSI